MAGSGRGKGGKGREAPGSTLLDGESVSISGREGVAWSSSFSSSPTRPFCASSVSARRAWRAVCSRVMRGAPHGRAPPAFGTCGREGDE